MRETLAEIDCPAHGKNNGFNVGIVLWDDVVVEAAPLVDYMKRGRWTRERVREYCQQRGWRVSVVHEIERDRPPWWRK